MPTKAQKLIRQQKEVIAIIDRVHGPVRRDKDGLVKCRVCSCTEIKACAPPCSWADDERGDICSSCKETAAELIDWLNGARRPVWIALIKEAKMQADEIQPIPYILPNAEAFLQKLEQAVRGDLKK